MEEEFSSTNSVFLAGLYVDTLKKFSSKYFLCWQDSVWIH